MIIKRVLRYSRAVGLRESCSSRGYTGCGLITRQGGIEIQLAGEERLEGTTVKAADRAAVLLTVAGVIVIVAAFAGYLVSWDLLARAIQTPSAPSGGTGLVVVLSMLTVAFVLGGAAVLWHGGGKSSVAAITPASRRSRLIFAVLVMLHCVLAILIVKPGRAVAIDTYTFQRDASRDLLHGIDPFGRTRDDIYNARVTPLLYGPGMVVNGQVQVGLQYPPLTLLWTLPGYLLGDVRISYLLAVLIAAGFSFELCPDARGLWLASALLFSPLTFLVEQLCWTEPLVLMLLSATVFAAVKKRWWLPIALGLFLASKQYNFLALPLITYFVRPFSWRAYIQLTVTSVAVGVATVLPFAVWNFHGLWHDLILFHLAQPFRQDAVSFAVLFPWILKIGPLLVLGLIVWMLRAERANAATFAAAYGLVLLLFVSTNKQAFANYYFLVAQAFFLSAVSFTLAES